MKLAWLVVLGSALAAAGALADTLRKGERLAGEHPPASGALPGFTVTLPGPAGGLAAHVDGRIALLVRQELVLLDVDGKTRVRRALPGAARSLAFGAAESVAAELATGSSVLRYRDLFTRAWDAEGGHRNGPAVAPAPLPAGGFVFARGNDVVLTDGEAHEIRRLRVPDEYELTQLDVLADGGIYAFATHHEVDTALIHLGWGERATIRAIVHGKASDRHLSRAGAELAIEDGRLVHVSLAGAITRTDPPDDGYAMTAFVNERAVGILHNQMVLFRREAGRIRAGAPFGAPIQRTDAGMIVPRVLAFSAGAHEPYWVLTADGTLWRSNDGELDAHPMQGTRCDSSSPAYLTATAGRVLVACQNQLIAIGGKPEAPAAASDAGLTPFPW